MKKVVVIGAGMGGLSAALRLVRHGLEVCVLEARGGAGGLASAFEVEGFRFDCGPYVLLDRPGLEWAFRAAGLELEQLVHLRRIEEVYQVSCGGAAVLIHADAKQTAAGFERLWPGSGARYVQYVESMGGIYRRLRPMLGRSHPGVWDLIRGGSWRHAGFLLQTLGSVLSRVRLPEPVKQAIVIWTYVAGQPVREAPSPMALVPALIHEIGCFYPAGGIGAIPQALFQAAERAGVQFRFGVKAVRIRVENGRARGVETSEGEFSPAGAVISNHSAPGTYLNMVEGVPGRVRERIGRLPLQSPGMCAYLALKGNPRSPYLRFELDGERRCRLLIAPAVLDPTVCRDGWCPARLLGPMDFREAERLGAQGQRDYLERLLQETWWREGVEDYRVLATRVPAQWGAEFHLYRDSMNPVMTARFMRAGRFAHRSPFVRGLYLAGSSTHPGQWVSFCAISGILAANCLIEDLGRC